MSKPGRAAEYTAPPAEATPLQDVPPIPEPTGSASRDGAATAPPANLDGASPAATAPEAPVSPIQRESGRDRIMRLLGGEKALAELGVAVVAHSSDGVLLSIPRPHRYRTVRVKHKKDFVFDLTLTTSQADGWTNQYDISGHELLTILWNIGLELPKPVRCERCGL